jgi:hypothetical protein
MIAVYILPIKVYDSAVLDNELLAGDSDDRPSRVVMLAHILS